MFASFVAPLKRDWNPGRMRVRLSQFFTLSVVISLTLLTSSGWSADSSPLPRGMVLTTPTIPESITGTLRSVNEKMSAGIRPEENAVIWLVHVYGGSAFEPELRSASLEMLGIEKLSPESPLYVSPEDFVVTLDGVKDAQVKVQASLLQEQLMQAGSKFWNHEEWSRLAAYLAANEKALDTLNIAADRPRYYAPLLTPEDPPRLISASLVIERRLPFLARMLTARALMRFVENDYPGCAADLLTCRKLAVLLAKGSPFDVSIAKAHVVDAFAFQAETALLESGKMTAEQLNSYRTQLKDVSPFPSPAVAADIGERAILHQEIEFLKSDPGSIDGFFEVPGGTALDPDQKNSLKKIDWDQAFQRANEVQNQIVEALATQDRTAQNKLFQALDQLHAAWEKHVNKKTEHFLEEFKKDPVGTSRWVGEDMALSLWPLYRQRRRTEDRSHVRRSLILVSLVLEEYQRAHQKFPETLEVLMPKYLDHVPLDACTDAPLVYVRSSPMKARLMSLGNNQKNDAGQLYNDDFEVKLR